MIYNVVLVSGIQQSKVYTHTHTHTHTRLPWWLSGKESACNAGDAGDVGLTPGLGGSPGRRNGNPLQDSCLGNSMAEEPGGLQSMGSQRVGQD